MIQFSCTCGTMLRVKDEHAGKQTRCPKCGAEMTVPATREAPPPAPPPPPPRRPRDEDVSEGRPQRRPAAGYGDEGEAYPRAARPRRRKLWPWLTAASVLLVVGLGIGAWLLFFRGGGSTADLDLVPGDAVGFVSVRVGEWWEGP